MRFFSAAVLFAMMLLWTLPGCRKNESSEKSEEPAPASKPEEKPKEQSPSSRAEEATGKIKGAVEEAAGKATEGVEKVLARGKEAFNTAMCFKCHREDATGSDRAPDLTDDQWLHCDGSIEGIRKVITSGVSKEQMKGDRPFAMNPVTNFIKDDEVITALATYVHSLSQ